MVKKNEVVDLSGHSAETLSDWFASFKRETGARFSVSGYKTIDFSYQKSDSEPNTIHRQESLKLQLSGSMMQTTVNADIQQSSTGTREENKSQIELKHDNFWVKLGEFRTSFANKSLMQYTDALDGAEAKIMTGQHHLGMIVSNPKGFAKKEQFQGNQSQGPFTVQFRPVVPGSETVFLEGVLQKKGQDYSMDYSTGEIRFLSRLIRSEERLEVRYETENLLYKDQVWGLNYGYESELSSFGLYYLNKKETQTQGFLRLEQGLGDYRWRVGDWHAAHELSWSRRQAHADEALSGLAFFSQGGYETPSVSVTIEGLTASDAFSPVSGTAVSPGDYRYSIATAIRDGAKTYTGLARERKQGYGLTWQQETFLQSGFVEKNADSDWRLGMTHEVLSDVDSLGNAVSEYQRQTGDVAFSTPVLGAPFSERVRVVRKAVSIGTSPSFKSLETESRWAFLTANSWQTIGEATLRWRHEAPTKSIEEQVFRWTSSYSHSARNHIQAVSEQRYQTDSFPITLANISAAMSPFLQWEQSVKLQLENLKERYNSQVTDTSKWDFAYNTSLRPFSGYESRYVYKTQFKDIDRRGVYPYWNQDFSWDNRFSFSGGQVSLQHRERIQDRQSLEVYPLVSPESSGTTKTTVARFQNRPFPRVTLSTQGEWETANTQTGVAETRVAQQTVSQRLKSELAMQMDRHSAGLSMDLEKKMTEAYSLDHFVQHRYGTYVQFNWLPSTLRCELSFSQYSDADSYESYTPSLRYTFRPSSVFDFSVSYSLERIFRTTGVVDNPSWDMAVKAELGRLILSGTIVQSLKVGSPERFEAYLKMSYLF